uniref:Uncharacterized protein n=1 Tax=Arundo donax TaxID=35708 RepID=A0A0A8Z9D5_ARUDO
MCVKRLEILEFVDCK